MKTQYYVKMATITKKDKLENRIKGYRKTIRQITNELYLLDEDFALDYDLELHNIGKKLTLALNQKEYLKN